ncbi:oxygen tolerance protein BatD [Ulvibacter sp. MAR_2010_11]|uniref:BatD family protein n=1 Tax=Ulvibacter sp. MAR_2010_11 TaxID=1250229 RepID=UPI000C2C525A|nr:BatD family protein [Ulvibacter sp. MAR_2010_11]PKA83044.1 oxygen tolerance protein BatD [Ulvibacter sp. MAR_2010_11]
MKLKHFIYVLFFIASCGAMQAQIQFEAKLSKKRLGINERLRVDFEMNQDGDNFNPPDFRGFRVVGGPNQAISNSYINGRRSYSKTYSYFLSPQSRGKFTIGQATIEIEGQTYKTNPIEVEITAAVEQPKDENNAEYVASENVHLVAEVSNSNPYLNEAITVVYKMYVSHDVSITSSWREIDTPKYADFWSQNIDNQGNFKIYEGEFKGENYRYVILRTTVLYPQKTGELNIEPLTLDVPIDVQGNKRDIFGRRLMTRVNKTISAGNRTITVKPLPTEGRPDNFNGAVGSFQFNVTTNKTTLDAGEALEMAIKVSGEGNIKLFDLPTVKLPSSLEMYEPERSENVRTNRTGMAGDITEKYTIVPQFKGNYPIRPIPFSYFDPKTEKYNTISSNEIILNVVNGPVTSENSTTSNNSDSKKAVVLSKEQFKYIKLNAELQSKSHEPFFKSVLFWSLLGGPLLLIPIFIIVGKKRDKRLADYEGNRLRKADRMAKKYLSEAKKNMANKATFYEALERALHNYLKAKLNIETSEMAKDRIAVLLEEREVSGANIQQFTNLLKSCEFARYTPASNVTIQQDYNKAVETIAAIDKQIQ